MRKPNEVAVVAMEGYMKQRQAIVCRINGLNPVYTHIEEATKYYKKQLEAIDEKIERLLEQTAVDVKIEGTPHQTHED